MPAAGRPAESPPPPLRVAGHETQPWVASHAPACAADGAGHQTQPGVAFDAQLARIAGPGHLVFALDELVALGLSPAGVRARAAAGRLHRVHQGVYSLVPVQLLTARGRYRAATLACRGFRHAAALSHRSAAGLHGLRECHRRDVEVIVPGRSTHRHPGIQVHRSVRLDPGVDLMWRDGILTTTVARTFLDLAAVVVRREIERAVDQAEVLRVFDLDAVVDQIRRNPGAPGAGVLRAVLDRQAAGSTRTDSELEERLWVLLDASRLPRPELHGPIDCGDGGLLLRPDFVWRDQRVAGEVDGVGAHLTRRAFEADRRRDQRLIAAGWRVIRITWRQLTEHPHEVAEVLRRLLTD